MARTKPSTQGKDFRKTLNLSAEREGEVGRLLTQCIPHGQIIAYLRQKWGVSDETVKRAIREVYDRWQKLPSLDREARREQMRQALMDFYHDARKKGAYAPAVTALDRLCKIDGLYAPQQVQVDATTTQGVAASNPEQVRGRIRDLYRRFVLEGGETGANVGVGVALSAPVGEGRPSDEPVGAGGEGPPVSVDLAGPDSDEVH